MILGLALIAALAGTDTVPGVVVVAGTKGEARIVVRADENGNPVLPAAALMSALDGSAKVVEGWAEVAVGSQNFRFLVGAPLCFCGHRLRPLASGASVTRDTLYLPLQFIAEILPASQGGRFRYDGPRARLSVAGAPDRSAVARGTPPVEAKLPNGLRPGHSVTIDPGHGGVDPGNPGVFFPRGTKEKDVTLQVGLLLRNELKRRGVAVNMTRTADTLIALGDRGSYCTESCDLFVSLHVNSLARRHGYTDIRGFETYFLAEARTEDAARVAQMENEAVRFETNAPSGDAGMGLDFILKDLQLNEHLRESARAAELVQGQLKTVHTGDSRGVKQAGFMVLTTARRPAILVELGYSTNPEDGRFLTSYAGQKAMAAALADAIVEYLLEYQRKTEPVVGAGGLK